MSLCFHDFPRRLWCCALSVCGDQRWAPMMRLPIQAKRYNGSSLTLWRDLIRTNRPRVSSLASFFQRITRSRLSPPPNYMVISRQLVVALVPFAVLNVVLIGLWSYLSWADPAGEGGCRLRTAGEATPHYCNYCRKSVRGFDHHCSWWVLGAWREGVRRSRGRKICKWWMGKHICARVARVLDCSVNSFLKKSIWSSQIVFLSASVVIRILSLPGIAMIMPENNIKNLIT